MKIKMEAIYSATFGAKYDCVIYTEQTSGEVDRSYFETLLKRGNLVLHFLNVSGLERDIEIFFVILKAQAQMQTALYTSASCTV